MGFVVFSIYLIFLQRMDKSQFTTPAWNDILKSHLWGNKLNILNPQRLYAIFEIGMRLIHCDSSDLAEMWQKGIYFILKARDNLFQHEVKGPQEWTHSDTLARIRWYSPN